MPEPAEAPAPAAPAAPAGAARQRVEGHPRLWGAVFAVALLAAYAVALRPARMWVAERVAYPALAAIDTPRARTLAVVRLDGRADAVWAVPRALVGPASPAEVVATERAAVAEWAVPVGVLFVLPAMLLVAVYPTRPYWLWLLAYHVAIGLAGFAVYALGVAYAEPAFALYTFSRTYLTESVSLVLPLLLLLSGGALGRLGPAADGPGRA